MNRRNAKRAATFWTSLLGSKNQNLYCLALMVRIVLSRRRVVTTKTEQNLHVQRIFSANHKKAHPEMNRRGKYPTTYGIIVSTPHWMIQLAKISFPFSLSKLSVYNEAIWFSVFPTTILSRVLTFEQILYSYCKRSRPWNDKKFPRKSAGSLELAAVSKTRTFHQPSSASSISPNQKGTVEMRDEVLSSVDAQELDTSGYLVSDLEDIEFHWGELGLNMDAVCWPGIDTPFSPSTLNDFEMNLMAENPTLFDEEEDKENCPSLPTTPVSERPSEHPVLMNNRPFGT